MIPSTTILLSVLVCWISFKAAREVLKVLAACTDILDTFNSPDMVLKWMAGL